VKIESGKTVLLAEATAEQKEALLPVAGMWDGPGMSGGPPSVDPPDGRPVRVFDGEKWVMREHGMIKTGLVDINGKDIYVGDKLTDKRDGVAEVKMGKFKIGCHETYDGVHVVHGFFLEYKTPGGGVDSVFITQESINEMSLVKQ
jgi:hypothetical protein